MNVYPLAEAYRKLYAASNRGKEPNEESEFNDESEWLLSALGRYTGAELRELLHAAEEPGFFELMRGIFALSESSRDVLKTFLEGQSSHLSATKGKSTQELAEVYESLKDVRRKGELLQLNALSSDVVAKLDLAELTIIHETSTETDSSSTGFAGATERLGRFARHLEIRTLANRVFGGEEKAEAWLTRSNSSLSGQSPLDLLKDELGTAVVREMLERIDHGIFA